MPILDHFGWVAPYYEKVNHLHDVKKLIELLELPTRGLLLDAGGGTGRIAQMLVGQVGAVLIADASYGMLCEAYKKKGLTTAGIKTWQAVGHQRARYSYARGSEHSDHLGRLFCLGDRR
jgi:ubiquinone/menaquinone biosynthesis C-methylase UbiE